jgi:hypothetical protein
MVKAGSVFPYPSLIRAVRFLTFYISKIHFCLYNFNTKVFSIHILSTMIQNIQYTSLE